MGVLFADPAVLAVDHQLAVLVFRKLPSFLERFVLGVEGVALLPIDLERPTVAAWHYVNIAHSARYPAPMRAVRVERDETPSSSCPSHGPVYSPFGGGV